MREFAEYQNAYKDIRFKREDGILEMAIHRDGGSAVWGATEVSLHRQLSLAFWDIAHDPENKVLIFTGLGDVFCTELDFNDMPPLPLTPAEWYRIYKEGKELLHGLLDIEIPVIGAVNGDAFVHAELLLLSDLVVCADTARLADKAHFPSGSVPGDGVHVVWMTLLGPNRGRWFLIKGQEIGAQEALQLGVVGEVTPKDKLMGRAWELARELAPKPDLLRRYTRVVLTQYWKRRLMEELGHGLMAEGLAMGQPQ